MLALQPKAQKVKLAHDASLDAVALDGKQTLTIVMKDDIIDACIDGRRCIVNRLPDQNGSYLWFYAQGGSVSFTNVSISTLIPVRATAQPQPSAASPVGRQTHIIYII